jgi:hypothetical protein
MTNEERARRVARRIAEMIFDRVQRNFRRLIVGNQREIEVEALTDEVTAIILPEFGTAAGPNRHYAAYANHCAIQKKVPMTYHSWKRKGQPKAPDGTEPPVAAAKHDVDSCTGCGEEEANCKCKPEPPAAPTITLKNPTLIQHGDLIHFKGEPCSECEPPAATNGTTQIAREISLALQQFDEAVHNADGTSALKWETLRRLIETRPAAQPLNEEEEWKAFEATFAGRAGYWARSGGVSYNGANTWSGWLARARQDWVEDRKRKRF